VLTVISELIRLTTKPLRGHESDCVSSRVTCDRETERKEAAERRHTRERDHSERRSRSIPEGRRRTDTWRSRERGADERSTITDRVTTYIYIQRVMISCNSLCSADGSTHTESNKLYRKVKHRYRPNLSPRQRPTAKARHDQAALAALAEARGATHRARPRSPSRSLYVDT